MKNFEESVDNLENTTSEKEHGFNRRRTDKKEQLFDNPFLIPFFLILAFACIEFYAGVWAKSLALLGDAWHMFSDVFALGVAMVASYGARKYVSADHGGESKIEVVAAMINVVMMLGVITWIITEALRRLDNPQAIQGASGIVMLVALVGLIINLVAADSLHAHSHAHGAHPNLNHRAALLHVLGDVLGSLVALIAGSVIFFTGWLPIDPILSIVISILLLLSTLHLMKDIWQGVRGEKHAH